MEYLPNEGLLATSSFLFIELTTDASGTSTGFAVRYQGERYHANADETMPKSLLTKFRLVALKVEFLATAFAAASVAAAPPPFVSITVKTGNPLRNPIRLIRKEAGIKSRRSDETLRRH